MNVRTKTWRGQNWIRKERRLAIYARDGFACAWCGDRFGKLTLDHVVPFSLGGSNATRNLVTACAPCNGARGNRRADWKGPEALARVNSLLETPIALEKAKSLIAAHGNFQSAQMAQRV
jgi:hypothetical protein